MQVPELRPLGVGEVLDVSINLVRRNFPTLVKIVAVVAIPLQLVSAAFVYLAAQADDPESFVTVDETTGEAAFDGSFWAFFGGFVAVMLVAGLAYLIATAAATRAIGQAYVGETPEWRDSLRATSRRTGGVLLLTLIVGVLGFLGVLLCIVPGLYVFTISVIAFPALLLEGRSAAASFGRARALVSKRFLSTLGTMILASVISFIVQGIISAVVNVLAFVSGDLGDAIASFVGGSLSQLLTTPFMAAVAVVLYVDLRVRKEGFDLQLLARNVGAAPPGDRGWDDRSTPPPSTPPGGRGGDDMLFPPTDG